MLPSADELTVDGRRRAVTILPPAAGPDRAPLVLALHGNGGASMREWTTFDRQAAARGWAVAYPEGWQGCWADGRGVTAADESDVDDVAFLRAVIDRSAARYGTAPDRTVVVGMSNGGFMAHRLALAASERVPVLASVAAGLPAGLADRAPSHAVSVLLMHGTADRIAPIDGGYSRRTGPNGELRGRFLGLAETARRWRAIDRCPTGAGPTVATEMSTRTTVDGGVGGTVVAAWTLAGSGHTWPGTPVPPPWTEPTTLEFDGAEEICRFAAGLLIDPDRRRR